jgi:NAD(P)H-dependent FMN reductase
MTLNLAESYFMSPRKVVILKASETRQDSHSALALDEIRRTIESQGAADFHEYMLADFVTTLPSHVATVSEIPPALAAVADDMMDCDLLVIGTPIRNFAPSVLLQSFFQQVRRKLLTFDAQDRVVSRNFRTRQVLVVVTGISGPWKWKLFNRFVFFAHFDLLFDFWGPAYDNNILRVLLRPRCRVRKLFIPNARRSTFSDRKAEIAESACRFARKALAMPLSRAENSFF